MTRTSLEEVKPFFFLTVGKVCVGAEVNTVSSLSTTGLYDNGAGLTCFEPITILLSPNLSFD